jgi:uncharacterized membrane protein YraQ (UPF0718 family)
MSNSGSLSTATPPATDAGRGTVRTLLSMSIVLAMILVIPAGPLTGPYNALATIFASIVLEALPFMLFGAFVGGLIEAFVSRERMASLLPSTRMGKICTAAAMGLVFPVCECAVIPVVRRLIGKGLPFSAAIAYLLAGPIVNPIVAASTFLAYGLSWEVTALRLGLGYVIAVTVAVIIGSLFPGRTALRDGLEAVPVPACACGCADNSLKPYSQIADTLHAPTARTRLQQALRHGAADFLGVGHYLIIGAFVAALAQTFVDRSMLVGMMEAPIVSVLLMSGLAVALNLCSEADAFIAASFRGLVPLPGQMAFMLTGPMFDLKLLLMYQIIFRKRAILALSLLILFFTISGAAGLGFRAWPW